MDETPPQMPKDARGKRPDFYDTPGMDQAMSMILVLASELNVMRDRLDTVERIAAHKGLMLEDEIESYEPPETVRQAREARRQDFLDRLYFLARKDVSEQSRSESRDSYFNTLDEIARS